jgi:hypothetical protein
MPCYQSTNLPSGFTTAGRTGYATEAECLQACREGACCEGTTCTVKPQCQCQGTGQTFKGVGTTCTPNPCSLCDASSLSVSTSGAASGLYALWAQSYPCPNQSYSVSASGSGVLYRNDTFILARDVCQNAGAVEKCGFAGTYSTGSSETATVAIKFFSIGNDVRYAVSFQIVSVSASTKSACGPPPFAGGVGAPVDGGTAIFLGCSPVVGTVSQSGGLLVDVSSLPTFVISSGGSHLIAARGGQVEFSFNPLP